MIGALRILTFLLTVALSTAVANLRAASEEALRPKPTGQLLETVSRKKTVAQLILQLGNPQYLDRRSAELQLIELGADAFDQLQVAENHSDLEIASRARYLIHRIRIEWVRADDRANVQAIFRRYGELPLRDRLERLRLLGALEDHQGLGPLCRIARYDQSPILARKAALEVLAALLSQSDRNQSLLGATEFARLVGEVESSKRAPAEWIRLFLDHMNQPKKMGTGWLPLIDSELGLLKQQSDETDLSLVTSLLRFHLKLCDQFSQEELIFETMQRWVDLSISQGSSESESLIPALTWLLKNEQWKSFEMIESRYASQLRSSRLLVYLAAMARAQQGHEEEATEFAEQAFRLDDRIELRFQAAANIADLGRHDWAEREWKYLVETLPVLDEFSRRARESLATLRLHDRGENQAAAELLAVYCDAIESNPANKNGIRGDRVRHNTYQSFVAQRDFLFACHAQQQGDYAKQQKYLDRAIQAHPLNPDVVIAMYHLQDADEAYRKKTALLIRRSCEWLENNIEQAPDEPNWYNHWAWLVSNTEGDYKKAVKYSQHSLALSPESPSYLDTLGRCYYAAGDLDNAVATQRLAVAGHPYLLVMQRQLNFFEKELAEQNKK